MYRRKVGDLALRGDLGSRGCRKEAWKSGVIAEIVIRAATAPYEGGGSLRKMGLPTGSEGVIYRLDPDAGGSRPPTACRGHRAVLLTAYDAEGRWPSGRAARTARRARRRRRALLAAGIGGSAFISGESWHGRLRDHGLRGVRCARLPRRRADGSNRRLVRGGEFPALGWPCRGPIRLLDSDAARPRLCANDLMASGLLRRR